MENKQSLRPRFKVTGAVTDAQVQIQTWREQVFTSIHEDFHAFLPSILCSQIERRDQVVIHWVQDAHVNQLA